MKNYRLLLMLVACCWMLNGCTSKKSVNEIHADSVRIKYAKGFTIQELNNGNKIVEVGYPYQGAKSGYKYLLVQKGNEIPKHDGDVAVITIPIESIVCTSTTHIP